MEVLESVDSSELDDVVEKVLDAVEKQPCKFNLMMTMKMIVLRDPDLAVSSCSVL